MKKIRVNVSKSYNVLIGNGLLRSAGELISEAIPPCAAAVVADDAVFSLYGGTVVSSLEKSGYKTFVHTFPHGERSKNAENYIRILEFLAESRITRSDLVVALGGGVTGDLAGFAAATFLRGTAFVQLPTTFLAAIDSSVGGKTGIDLRAGKNLAGAFWQPSLVLCDPEVFDTLPSETFADGAAEAVKYGVISGGELFEIVKNGGIKDRLEEAIAACVAVKRDIVEKDERDTGLRRLLNLGHTFAHGIELLSGYRVSHGRAVAAGLCIAAAISEKTGYAKEPCLKPIASALEKYGLPTACPYTAAELALAALSDKKREGGRIVLVLIERLGKCSVKEFPVSELPRLAALGTGEAI